MIQSAVSATHTSTSSPLPGEQVIFTFFDIDDTAIALHSLEIKNAHLLLPTLLYMNVSNQLLGFMTNRPPTDDINPFKVSWLREDLLEFGIEIPKEHVIFGGGPEKNQIKVEQSRAVDASLATLNKLFDALKLSDMGSEQLDEMNVLIKRLDNAKFEGKNIHILDFLEGCFDQAKNSYTFANKVCIAKSKLKFILVDDLANIAAATSLLGASFVGIQASRGGNPPKVEDPQDDFYTVGYLHKLAAEVGLKDYANSLVSEPHKHKHDKPMLQIAALLYQWQKNKESCTLGRFRTIAAYLTDQQCEQIEGMIEYMLQMEHHPQAGYNSVEDLLPIFKARADVVFLSNAMRRFSVLEKRIASLHVSTQSEENPAPNEPSKEKKSSFLVRLASRGKTASAPPVIATSSSTNLLFIDKDVKTMIAILEGRKKALVDRITQLASSNNDNIASDAKMKLLSIVSRSSDATSNTSSSSSSSVSPRSSLNNAASASDAASLDAQIVLHRRSFTPAASRASSIGALRQVSSADSLTELEEKETDTPLDKPKKERSKKSGSHK